MKKLIIAASAIFLLSCSSTDKPTCSYEIRVTYANGDKSTLKFHDLTYPPVLYEGDIRAFGNTYASGVRYMEIVEKFDCGINNKI